MTGWGVSDEDLSLGSAYMSSYKPPTPPVLDMPHTTRPAHMGSMAQDSYRSGSSMSGDMGGTMGGTLSQEALEEKRRKALREREREISAKQRQRELLAQRRDMELKKRIEDEALRKLQETARLDEMQRDDMDKERRREDNRQRNEDHQRSEDDERRRLAQIEKKREQTLRTIELQRLREEESQRLKREVILKKRKEMERVRDQAERTFSSKKKDEMERKMWLVQVPTMRSYPVHLSRRSRALLSAWDRVSRPHNLAKSLHLQPTSNPHRNTRTPKTYACCVNACI